MMDRTDYMKGITTPAPLPAKLVKDCSCLNQVTVVDAFVKLEHTECKIRVASSTLLSVFQSLARLVAARSSSILAC